MQAGVFNRALNNLVNTIFVPIAASLIYSLATREFDWQYIPNILSGFSYLLVTAFFIIFSAEVKKNINSWIEVLQVSLSPFLIFNFLFLMNFIVASLVATFFAPLAWTDFLGLRVSFFGLADMFRAILNLIAALWTINLGKFVISSHE